MIGVVDYGAGNLRNVQAALARLGAPWRSVAAPDDLNGLAGLILPGVGQFGAAARRLREAGLDGALRGWIREDRPFLGICLGMQQLYTTPRPLSLTYFCVRLWHFGHIGRGGCK